MAISSTDYSVSIGSTEHFFIANSSTFSGGTDNCVSQWIVDVENLAAGDKFEFTVYETVNSTRKALARIEVDGARDKHIVFPAFTVTDGYDLGAKKLAGTDRTIKASHRTVS